MIKKYRLYLIVSALSIAALGSSIAFMRLTQRINTQESIVAFDYNQDMSFIRAIFKENWYWLVGEGSHLDIEHTFKYRVPPSDPHQYNAVTIYIYKVQNQPRGFIAYYKDNVYKGRIWFIAVLEAYRSCGYGHKLMQVALNDLQQQGIRIVDLITRTNNIPAQKLYRRFGFKETWRDAHFVTFEKTF